jgi:hypothetical protein
VAAVAVAASQSTAGLLLARRQRGVFVQGRNRGQAGWPRNAGRRPRSDRRAPVRTGLARELRAGKFGAAGPNAYCNWVRAPIGVDLLVRLTGGASS